MHIIKCDGNNEESDDIADMTDIQAMLLAENMSAFGDDSQVSDSMDMTDMTADTFITIKMRLQKCSGLDAVALFYVKEVEICRKSKTVACRVL